MDNVDLAGRAALDMSLKKECTNCHIEFPRTKENFYANKNAKDGLMHTCKPCSALKRKESLERNKINGDDKIDVMSIKTIKVKDTPDEEPQTFIEEPQTYIEDQSEKVEVLLDFKNHKELYADIVEEAYHEERDVDRHIIYILKTVMRIAERRPNEYQRHST